LATITPTITWLQGDAYSSNCALVTWGPVTESDTCNPANMGDFSDRSVQIAGTFGAATVVMQGSNDGTNYAPITDPQGNSISKTSAAIEAMTELCRYVKPTFSGGTGQSVTVTMMCKRAVR
jgi:hypothetical protein